MSENIKKFLEERIKFHEDWCINITNEMANVESVEDSNKLLKLQVELLQEIIVNTRKLSILEKEGYQVQRGGKSNLDI